MNNHELSLSLIIIIYYKVMVVPKYILEYNDIYILFESYYNISNLYIKSEIVIASY